MKGLLAVLVMLVLVSASVFGQSNTYLDRIAADIAAVDEAEKREEFGKLCSGYLQLADDYEQSLVIDRQPKDHADLVKALTRLKALQPVVEPHGLWTCYRPGEPTLIFQSWGRWKNMREVLDKLMNSAHRSVDRAAEQHKPAQALSTVKWAAGRMDKELASSQAGKGLPKLDKHPAYIRCREELARLEKWGETAGPDDPAPSRVSAKKTAPEKVTRIAAPSRRKEYGKVGKIEAPTQRPEYGRTGKIEAPTKRVEYGKTGKLEAPTERVEYGKVGKIEAPEHAEHKPTGQVTQPSTRTEYGKVGKIEAPTQSKVPGTVEKIEAPTAADTAPAQPPARPAATADADAGLLNAAMLDKAMGAIRRYKVGKPQVGFLMALLGEYEDAVIAGREPEGHPVMQKAADVITRMYPLLRQHLNTSYQPGERLLAAKGAPVNIRRLMDQTLMHAQRVAQSVKATPDVETAETAWRQIQQIAYRTGDPQAPKPRGFQGDIDRAQTPFGRCIAANKPPDLLEHGAYRRYRIKLSAIEKTPLKVLAGMQYRQAEAIFETFRRTAGKPCLVPDDMQELFDLAARAGSGEDADAMLRGLPMKAIHRYAVQTVEMQKRVVPDLLQAVKAYEEVYGTTAEEFQIRSAKIIEGLDNPAYAYTVRESRDCLGKLKMAIKSADEVRDALVAAIHQDSAERCQKAEENVRLHAQDWHRTVLEDAFAQIVPGLEALLTAAPDHKPGQALLARVKKGMGSVKEAELRRIQNATFPTGHYARFRGPGKANELAKSAIEYFKREWSGGERGQTCITTVVRGDWYCYKRNIFGQPVQWALPVTVAFNRDWGEWQAKDGYARVFYMSMLTPIEANGKKEPNWAMTGMGDDYVMLLENIKQ